MRTFSLIALLALTAGVGLAQEPAEPPAEAPAPAPSPVEISADLRAEYLRGEPMLVRFVVRNPGDSTAKFADIGNRPWLVRFELTYPDGRVQPWYNTPPDVDPGQRWSIVPRGQKRVLLQVPNSSRLSAGEYTLTIKIEDEGGERALPPHSFRVADPKPVAGEATLDVGAVSSTGHQVAWLHKASSGYDLYLHHSDGRDPTRTLGNYHLMNLSDDLDPVLTHARATERWDRFIYWQSSPRRVEFVRLQGEAQGLADAKPGRFETPYPEVELLGRGSTDSRGGLHVPLWVPAPSGKAGEVSVASVRERTGVRFRRVSRMDSRPDWLVSAVDANGDLRMLTGAGGNIDLYGLDAVTELPAVGRRLVKAGSHPDGLKAQTARFGVLEGGESVAGGMAVFVVYTGAEVAQGVWYSLTGEELKSTAVVPISPKAEVDDALPLADGGYVLLTRTESGQGLVVPSEGTPVGVGQSRGLLVQDKRGQVYLRSLGKNAPIKDRLVY